MPPEPNETMVVIVFPSGEIVTASIEEDSLVSTTQLLASSNFPPVDAPITLLRVAAALLPECSAKFRAFQAYRTAKDHWGAINDRMKVTAEKTDDELPF